MAGLCVAFAVLAQFSPAHAGNYTASNETTLRNAINAANADGDPSATITLTANISISNPAAFPVFAKPTTINTGAFTLSGADIASGTATGTSLTFGGGTFISTGSIRGGNAANQASGPGSAGGTAVSFGSGSVTNSAAITGGRGGNAGGNSTAGAGGMGVSQSNGSVTNSGTVTGGTGGNSSGLNGTGGAGGVGMSLSNSTLTNQNAITGGAGGTVNVNFGGSGATAARGGAGATGLVMSGGSLNNQGTVTGGAGGNIINIPVGGTDQQFGGAGGLGASLTGGTHVNSGTIAGAQGGIGSNVGSNGNGPSGGGVALAGGAALLNETSGTIIGADGRPGGGTGNGSAGGFGITVNNSILNNKGTITGGTGGGAAAGGVGATMTNNSSVTNTGTITGGAGGATGAGGAGMTITGGGTLNNDGTISGGAGKAAAAGGVGVTASGGARIVNSDTISGGLAGNGITRNNAITFSGGNNTLELHAGYVITGNVVATATDKLVLGGSTDSSFDASKIGAAAQYRNFGIYQNLGPATWTLTGTTTAVTPWQLLGGTLSVSSEGNLGAISGALTFNGGILEVTGPSFKSTARAINWGAKGGGFEIADPTNAFTVSQSLTGGGPLAMIGPGTLIMTGNNTYVGGTTITGGTLQLGVGGTTGSIKGDVLNNGTFAFNRSDTLTFDGVISGSGAVEQMGGGVTVLTANNSYLGATTVSVGTLLINGDQSGATGPTSVASGATLGGTGTIGGSVTVANGGILAPGLVGNVPGTLTIAKNLALNDTSQLNYDFGQANVVGGSLNDHTKVAGNLTLDGVINVTLSPGGSFLPGVYRVISYDGALTNNGLGIGTMPGPGPFFVQTAIASQVNLVNAAGLQLNYWDGDAGTKNSGVDGGNGTWNLVPANINWTDKDGTVNAPFKNGEFAIFAGAKGTVAVDNVSAGQVQFSGMQFLTDGYVIDGGALEMVGAPSYIRVGDGTLGYTATIRSQLFGSSQLVVTDPGTLVLTAANAYTGGTKIAQGATVQVSQDASLGDLSGDLTFDVGALRTTATFQTDRTVALDAQGQFLPDAGTTLRLGGPVSGPGSLVMGGAGELVLAAPATYAGDTTVAAGTLSAGAANVFSAGSNHSVLSGATLNLNGYDQTVSALSNAGTVSLNGPPGTTLTVTGNYTGAGGLITFNSVLSDDASATDRLVVQGDTAGSTDVKVTNVGGTGAPTVEGIKIVDVGGASNGAFALQGDYVFKGEQAVIGGAYAYTLHKNGVSTPTDGDWYLRSALINPPPDVPPGPLFQPGVPLYESYPQILLSLMSMPTLRERIGFDALGGRGPAPMSTAYIDEGGSYLGGPPAAGYERGPSYRDVGNAWWGRVDASRISIEPSSTASAAYDADQVRLQTGFDALIYADRAGKLLAGLTVQHGSSSARVDSVWGDGKINVEAYGIGGTLTWLGLNGFYVDTQAQVTWFDTDIRSSLAGTMTEGDDAVGYGISLETGKRFAAFGPWALTPQAQLSYTSVDLDFTDAFGAEVSTRNGDSLLGRLGIALDYRNAWLGARSNMYGIANLYYEFLDGTSIDVSGTRFVSRKDELWGGLGLGGMYSWGADKYALFGEVSVNTSLDNFGDSYSVNGTAGFRIRW